MVNTLPFNAGGSGSDPTCLMAKSSEQEQHFNKFNKDFQNGPHQKNFLKNQKLPFEFLSKCIITITQPSGRHMGQNR